MSFFGYSDWIAGQVNGYQNRFELANSQIGSNNFKYQNQERVADYGLSWDFFSRRPSDNQLGRFTSIDPIASDFPYNSPYALQKISSVWVLSWRV